MKLHRSTNDGRFLARNKLVPVASSILIVLAAISVQSMASPVVAQPILDNDEPTNARPLTRAQLWALACTALLTEYRQENHDSLGGCEITSKNKERVTETLSSEWDVRSHADLLRTIGWLEKGGQRVEFDRYVAVCKARSSPKIQAFIQIMKKHSGEEEYQRKLDITSQNLSKLNGKTLIGWDYCRVISLSRWGYVAGYMSESEAWSKIMQAAQVLQQNFSSWNELGMNYMVGRKFWSKQATETSGALYETNYHKFLTAPNSPWRTLPWNTSLR